MAYVDSDVLIFK